MEKKGFFSCRPWGSRLKKTFLIVHSRKLKKTFLIVDDLYGNKITQKSSTILCWNLTLLTLHDCNFRRNGYKRSTEWLIQAIVQKALIRNQKFIPQKDPLTLHCIFLQLWAFYFFHLMNLPPPYSTQVNGFFFFLCMRRSHVTFNYSALTNG